MKKPDDSTLSHEQYLKVRSEAERLLSEASAFGRFPTPVDDLMAAAKVGEVSDDVLSVSFVRKMRHKAGDALKQAVEKVLGLFDALDRLVFIDRSLHLVKQTFIRLHETGHGFMLWQRDAYVVVEECRKTLAPDIADEFDREANVFASEVLFQLDQFNEEAEGSEFSIFTPVNLSKKYGASIYASIRRYVSQNWRACTVLILNMPELVEGDGFRASLRRPIASTKFLEIFGNVEWPSYFTPDDMIGKMVPINGSKMSGKQEIFLQDRNGDHHECVAEAFTQTFQVFILIHAVRTLTASSVIIPTSIFPSGLKKN